MRRIPLPKTASIVKQQIQKAYLFASGILENGTSEEIVAAKKAYRKAYLKEKKRVFRKTHRTVSLSFPRAEAKELEALAEQYKMRLAPFLKSCIRAYTQQQYLPPNPEKLQQLELLLRAIGNNINQIAKRCNSGHISPQRATEQSYVLLQSLDNRLTKALREPDNLEVLLWETMLARPSYRERVEQLLTAAKNQTPFPYAHQDPKT